MHKSKRFGKFVLYGGLFLLAIDWIFPLHVGNFKFSNYVLANQLFLSLSRVTYVTGALLIFLAIILGRFGTAKAHLSNNIMRISSKSLAIACVL